METKTIVTIIFWLLSAGFALLIYIHAFHKIIAQKQKVEMFAKWGYSIFAMRLIGFVEVTGASLLLFPLTRLYSIPIYAVLLSGAVYTHIKNKDTKEDTMGPFIAGAWLSVALLLTIWM